MISLALSSWSLHRHLPNYVGGRWEQQHGDMLSITEFPRIARELGFDQFEICQMHLESTDPAYLDGVRAAVETADCHVLNVPIDIANVGNPDPEKREENLRLLESWIDAAHRLGSPCVRVNTGHGEGLTEEQALELIADGYRRLAAYCGQQGMTLLMENHGGISSQPSGIAAILERVDSPSFRLCPDFGNFPADKREEGLRMMLPHAALVHAKAYDFATDNDSVSVFRQCLDLVRDSGYSGALSIEFEGKGEEYAGIRRATDLVREWMAESEAVAR